MMLFKLSAKNITKSVKDYAIYFFTLVLGVAIFYVFNAIDSQSVMPVSYTHLDVYKRQALLIIIPTIYFYFCEFRLGKWDDMSTSNKAVSYTHLDVYQRQEQSGTGYDGRFL